MDKNQIIIQQYVQNLANSQAEAINLGADLKIAQARIQELEKEKAERETADNESGK